MIVSIGRNNKNNKELALGSKRRKYKQLFLRGYGTAMRNSEDIREVKKNLAINRQIKHFSSTSTVHVRCPYPFFTVQ